MIYTKKNFIRGLIVLVVVAAAYSAIAFVPPFVHTSVFWISYLFTVLAIISQGYVIYIAFEKGKSVKSKFYGIPIARVGIYYLIGQFIVGIVFILSAGIAPIWLPLLIYAVMLGAAVVGFIIADAVREEVYWQDAKLDRDVSCMRGLQSRAISILNQTKDDSAAEGLRKFSEELRFSDPVSNEILQEIESDLTACMDDIERAVVDNDMQCVHVLCQKARAILVERNRLCKLSKSSVH